MMEPYVPCTPEPDFHGVMGATVGELYTDGLIRWDGDPSAPDLDWSDYAYSPEQYSRVCEMFVAKFWLREPSMYPLKPWALMVKELFREKMQKYTLLYQRLDKDDINIFQDLDTYSKERSVYSDFPATQLNTANQDYASSANDHESENVQEGGPIDKAESFRDRWLSADVALLEEIGPLIFSSLYTVSVDGL